MLRKQLLTSFTSRAHAVPDARHIDNMRERWHWVIALLIWTSNIYIDEPLDQKTTAFGSSEGHRAVAYLCLNLLSLSLALPLLQARNKRYAPTLAKVANPTIAKPWKTWHRLSASCSCCLCDHRVMIIPSCLHRPWQAHWSGQIQMSSLSSTLESTWVSAQPD